MNRGNIRHKHKHKHKHKPSVNRSNIRHKHKHKHKPSVNRSNIRHKHKHKHKPSVNRSNIRHKHKHKHEREETFPFSYAYVHTYVALYRKCEPGNIRISISIMKQQYLMSGDIQVEIVSNPAPISSFKMASSSSGADRILREIRRGSTCF